MNNKDENGRIKVERVETIAEQTAVDVEEIKKTLTRMFQPDGVCDSRHNNLVVSVQELTEQVGENKGNIKTVMDAIRTHKWLIGIILTILIAKIAFF